MDGGRREERAEDEERKEERKERKKGTKESNFSDLLLHFTRKEIIKVT